MATVGTRVGLVLTVSAALCSVQCAAPQGHAAGAARATPGPSESVGGQAGGIAPAEGEASSAGSAPMGSQALPVMEEGSSTEPGWLGVELAARSAQQAGVELSDVMPGSPAQAAGLIAGDIVLQIEGAPVVRPRDVSTLVASRYAGERLALVLERQGKQRIISVQLGSRPDSEGLLRQRYINSPAPELTGGKVASGALQASLKSLRGRVVVLEFWASWCVACRALMPTLNAWHDRYSAQGVTVIGVTMDGVAEAALHASRLGMKYGVIADPDATITRGYRAMALPTVFVIDKQGRVRDLVVGFAPERFAELGQLVERLSSEN